MDDASTAVVVPDGGPTRGRKRLHNGEQVVTRRRAGAARQTGRLERVEARFVLAPGVPSPGEIPWTVAAPMIIRDWERQVREGTVSAAMIATHTTQLTAFAAYETAFGRSHLRDTTTTSVAQWIPTPVHGSDMPPVNTQYNRRSALRAAFITAHRLGLHDLNPAMSVELPRRYARYVNPLTDEQIAQLKQCAAWRLGEVKTPVVLALALLGANLSEIGYVRVADVDLMNHRVWVHDGGARSFDRWIPMDDPWAMDMLSRRVANLVEEAGLVDSAWQRTVAYSGESPSRDRRAAAVATTLTNLMKKARVHRPGRTRVESVREWLAQSVYAETGRIEAAAARLGMSSLDAAAHIIGIDWQREHLIDAPPPASAAPGGDFR